MSYGEKHCNNYSGKTRADFGSALLAFLFIKPRSYCSHAGFFKERYVHPFVSEFCTICPWLALLCFVGDKQCYTCDVFSYIFLHVAALAEHNYMCAILVIIKLLGKSDPHQTIIKVFLWIRLAFIANGPTDILNQISDSKYLNILRPDRNCRHFANGISKNFLKRKLFWFKLRWCLFLKVQLIKSALVQVIE